ncbi:MAG: endolytic transglycosylase MltG [Candidatus Paceibacterota bacterium]
MNIERLLNKIFKSKIVTVVSLAFFVIIVAFAVRISSAPENFPKNEVVRIEEGSSLNDVAGILEEKSIIRSAFVYKTLVTFQGGSKKILAGDYLFENAESAWKIASRTVNGEQGIPQVKITIPEGMASYDIARLIEKKLPYFDSVEFLRLAKKEEGRLFPDTYYFFETVTPAEAVTMMTENFERKTKSLSIRVNLFGRPFEDVLKMASIIEREANGSKDRRIIAGVLWKRIDNDHPLQVDQPFFYTLGKASSNLTMDDLRSDSPYNLYTHKGLPPTPTGNPGLGAIVDTMNPTDTDYWFYLSDKKGNMHYAVTHDGHLENKDKYID